MLHILINIISVFHTCYIFFILFLYFHTLLRISIHYFHIFNTYYPYFQYIFPYFQNIFLYFNTFFHIFNTIFILVNTFFRIFNTLIKYLSITCGCDVRAWRKSGLWSPLGKYVHSMQYTLNHGVRMYVDYN
jgi:hypothetical protein